MKLWFFKNRKTNSKGKKSAANKQKAENIPEEELTFIEYIIHEKYMQMVNDDYIIILVYVCTCM